MSEKLTAIVVAAGASRRMGFDKILEPLAGRPLLVHTVERLLRSPQLSEVVLVVRKETEAAAREALQPTLAAAPVPVKFVHGGKERQDSVRAGLEAASAASHYVLIHDGARPFITPELIEKTFAAAREHGAAVCGHPSTDTLKETTGEGKVVRTVDRSKIWAVQTPQIFRKSLLSESYAAVHARGETVTDDTAAVEKAGHAVWIVAHREPNLKLTNPEDWPLAQALLAGASGAAGAANPQDPQGQELRRLLHDVNNHLTSLMGYAFLLANELPEESELHKYAKNLNTSSEKLHLCAREMQQLVRALFPKEEELG